MVTPVVLRNRIVGLGLTMAASISVMGDIWAQFSPVI